MSSENISLRPQKTLKISASGEARSTARTDIAIRQHMVVIDEPVERHGTDIGGSPLELLAGSLIGCTNVIASRIAADMGITLDDMKIDVTLGLDPAVLAEKQVDSVFPTINMVVSALSNASPREIEVLKERLAKGCPVSALFRQAGSNVIETWKIASSQ